VHVWILKTATPRKKHTSAPTEIFKPSPKRQRTGFFQFDNVVKLCLLKILNKTQHAKIFNIIYL